MRSAARIAGAKTAVRTFQTFAEEALIVVIGPSRAFPFAAVKVWTLRGAGIRGVTRKVPLAELTRAAYAGDRTIS
jgi:hypothetical protein